jgi:hypothetical protein
MGRVGRIPFSLAACGKYCIEMYGNRKITLAVWKNCGTIMYCAVRKYRQEDVL